MTRTKNGGMGCPKRAGRARRALAAQCNQTCYRSLERQGACVERDSSKHYYGGAERLRNRPQTYHSDAAHGAHIP